MKILRVVLSAHPSPFSLPTNRRRFPRSVPDPCFSTIAFRASRRKPAGFPLERRQSSPSSSSSSPATRKSTLRTRPPMVAISARSVLMRRDLSVSISSGRRSERSSQHKEALKMVRPPGVGSQERTAMSSDSEGKWLSSGISDVCCFSSLTCCTTLANREALSV